MKCQIKWINCQGVATPDDNEAVGMATCHSAHALSSTAWPICAEHLKSINQVHHGRCNHKTMIQNPWTFTPFEVNHEG